MTPCRHSRGKRFLDWGGGEPKRPTQPTSIPESIELAVARHRPQRMQHLHGAGVLGGAAHATALGRATGADVEPTVSPCLGLSARRALQTKDFGIDVLVW